MTFHVPVSVNILRVVLFVAANLDLFESPLRQDRICSSQITPKMHVSEPQPGCQRVNFFEGTFASPFDIVHNLNPPMVLHITNRVVTVTRHLMVEFGDGGRDRMGV